MREVLYPKSLVIRIDEDSLRELDVIAVFEKVSRCALARQILIEKIQVYNRRPDYKAYRKKMDRMIAQT